MAERSLSLALYALKEEAAAVWKESLDGSIPDLTALDRSWQQVVREIMKLEHA